MVPGEYFVYVRDTNLQIKEIVDDYKSLELVKRFNKLGAWKLEIDYDSKAAQAFISAFSVKDGSNNPINKGRAGILVMRNGSYLFSGPIRRLQEKWNADGHTLTLEGPDDMVFLDSKIEVPGPAPYDFRTSYTSAYYYTSGSAEYVMKQIVDTQLGPNAAARRQIANLTIVGSQSRGYNPTSTNGRFQNVLRELQRIAYLSENKGVPIGFNLIQTTSGTPVLQFDCYLPQDKSTSVIFSPDLGNVAEYEYTQEAPTGNFIIAGDANKGTTRGFAYAGDEPSRGLYGDIELFVNGANAATNELVDEVYKALEDNAEKTGFTFTPIEVPGVMFQTDWDLGTKVSFRKGTEELKDLIREVRIKLSPQGEEITPVMGTAGVGKTFRLFDKTRNLEYRTNDQERY